MKSFRRFHICIMYLKDLDKNLFSFIGCQVSWQLKQCLLWINRMSYQFLIMVISAWGSVKYFTDEKIRTVSRNFIFKRISKGDQAVTQDGLRLLPLEKRRLFHRCLCVFKSCQNAIPSVTLLPRCRDSTVYNFSHSDRLSLIKPRTEWSTMRFKFQAVTDFNNLDKEFRTVNSCRF